MTEDLAIAKQAVRLDISRSEVLSNPLTGYGTSRDLRSHFQVMNSHVLQDWELRALYRHSATCAIVVDAYPDKAIETWLKPIELGENDEPAIAEETLNYLNRIESRVHFADGDRWARLFGGSVVVVGVNDGRPFEEPVNDNGIQSIDFLRPLDRCQIFPDILSGHNYSDPEYYRYIPTGLTDYTNGQYEQFRNSPRIHKSRVLRFEGKKLDYYSSLEQYGWGDSVLQRFYTSWRDWMIGQGAAAQILNNHDIFVHSLKGLSTLIGTKGRSEIRAFYHDLWQTLEQNRFIAVDGDVEGVGYQARTYSGIKETVDSLERRMSQAADGIPHFVLWGTVGQAALSDSGSAEEKAWCSKVHQRRELEYSPRLRRLVELIWQAKDGPKKGGFKPKQWNIKFEKLFALTEREEAELKKTIAETDKIRVEMGAYGADLVLDRHRGTEFNTEIVVPEGYEAPGLQAPEEKAPDAGNESDRADATEPLFVRSHGLPPHKVFRIAQIRDRDFERVLEDID